MTTTATAVADAPTTQSYNPLLEVRLSLLAHSHCFARPRLMVSLRHFGLAGDNTAGL